MGSTKYLSTGWMPALIAFAAASAGAAEQAPPPPTYAWAPWQGMPWTGWMGWMGLNPTPWPAFGLIIMFAFFVLMAIACGLMMRHGGIGCCRWSGGFGRGEAGGRAPNARERLDERYVSGEIDEREYAHMKAVLASPPSPSSVPNPSASTARPTPGESLPSSS